MQLLNFDRDIRTPQMLTPNNGEDWLFARYHVTHYDTTALNSKQWLRHTCDLEQCNIKPYNISFVHHDLERCTVNELWCYGVYDLGTSIWLNAKGKRCLYFVPHVWLELCFRRLTCLVDKSRTIGQFLIELRSFRQVAQFVHVHCRSRTSWTIFEGCQSIWRYSVAHRTPLYLRD